MALIANLAELYQATYDSVMQQLQRYGVQTPQQHQIAAGVAFDILMHTDRSVNEHQKNNNIHNSKPCQTGEETTSTESQTSETTSGMRLPVRRPLNYDTMAEPVIYVPAGAENNEGEIDLFEGFSL